MHGRTYMDNAATSFPKPAGVVEAMVDYATRVGASPGRGQYGEAREGAAVLRTCRERVAEFIGHGSPDHIIFALNTSDALNLAIKGVVRGARLRGERVRLVTSVMDHNSVLRPFAAVQEDGDAEVVHVRVDPRTHAIDLRELGRVLAPGATLLAINAVSNVTGAVQPIAEAANVARECGVPVLVDGAQALGHIPLSFDALGIDLLAFPGHKGLLGPQGTGGLAIRPGFAAHLATTREGGTGSLSELAAQPARCPERFEAGSHNTVGLAGLSAGVAWLLERDMTNVRKHEEALMARFLSALRESGCRAVWDDANANTNAIAGEGGACVASLQPEGPLAGLMLLGPTSVRARVATFSFVHAALSPHELAELMEEHAGVLGRAGLHCAPLAHEALGTVRARADGHASPGPICGAGAAWWGAFRLSFGAFTTMEDVDRAAGALRDVCAGVLPHAPRDIRSDLHCAGF